MERISFSERNSVIYREDGCYFEVRGNKGRVTLWRITDDCRAIESLRAHIERFGSFTSSGSGKRGNLKDVLFHAYRPYGYSAEATVRLCDENPYNLSAENLFVRGDPVPTTKGRRIWHDEQRIYIKCSANNTIFFTEFNPSLYVILCCTGLTGWYVYHQPRKNYSVDRLYCRIQSDIVSLPEIVWIFHEIGISHSSIAEDIRRGKEQLKRQDMEIDHLRDNRGNNCIHNLAAISRDNNALKSNRLIQIKAPFYFIPVRIGNVFRIMCGNIKTRKEFWIVCHGEDDFVKCLLVFHKAATSTTAGHDSACISQLLCDDGRAYQDGKRNPIEVLLHTNESEFLSWSDELSENIKTEIGGIA